MTNLLIPWSIVRFEKLIVAQVVKIFPAFYEARKANYHGYKNPPPNCILSQANPMHILMPSAFYPSGFPAKMHAFLI
jgi:hypothetical protein